MDSGMELCACMSINKKGGAICPACCFLPENLSQQLNSEC